MQCEEMRPSVRKFLDDLLDEKDYQEIHQHLAGCQKCSTYTSSVGTLSWRLHELGQVSLPPDMTSTILYEMKHLMRTAAAPAPSEAAPSAPSGSPTRALWIAVIVLGAVSIGATAAAFFWRSTKGPAAFSISARAPFAPPGLPGLPAERLAETHIHYSQAGRQELSDLIIDMQLPVERESDRSIVFLIPAEKASEFNERLAAGSGFLKEFGTTDFEGKTGSRATVYFENQG